jgi:hypothetical protein
MWDVIKKNPISTFAVACVAATGIFLTYMAIWQTTILASPDWCSKAMRAEQIAPGKTYQQAMEALQSCNNLLLVQLSAVATDSHIDHGAVAFVLIVLIVVVIAGARASWKLGPTGMEGSVGRENIPSVPVTITNPPSSPVPTTEAPHAPPTGPAMPEPPPLPPTG